MLAEFGGKMVECEEVVQLSWGPKILISRAPPDPEEKARNRARIMAVCAQIQKKLNEQE